MSFSDEVRAWRAEERQSEEDAWMARRDARRQARFDAQLGRVALPASCRVGDVGYGGSAGLFLLVAVVLVLVALAVFFLSL